MRVYLLVSFLPEECEVLDSKVFKRVIDLLARTVDYMRHLVRNDEFQVLGFKVDLPWKRIRLL
jgi:hypothetical protein